MSRASSSGELMVEVLWRTRLRPLEQAGEVRLWKFLWGWSRHRGFHLNCQVLLHKELRAGYGYRLFSDPTLRLMANSSNLIKYR